MSRRASRRLLPIPFGLGVLVALCLVPVSVVQGDDIAAGPARQPAARVAKGTVVQQEFPASGTKIATVDLTRGTFERVAHGTFQVTLEAQRDSLGYSRWRSS